MANKYELNATVRADKGKGASRRLRRLGNEVPAIVYGSDIAPQMISLAHNELFHALEDEAMYSQVLTLKVDGKPQQVLLKDLQRHPSKPVILHADFMRISAAHAVTMHVPLHFLNEETCPGVKQGGGSINRNAVEVLVRCLPKDLPQFIEVDLGALQVGDILHLSNLNVPAGVELVELGRGADHDSAVVSILPPRGGADADEGSDSAGEEGASSAE
ncbi:MAG TPA: 50S ribosomal protein L25/general stress protein Ctc [Spongiibacteraceae bacterium]|jgi:large subunit ribosomal protein L25|nr:50S ribosomal protein L25/general stress protein Ctc [Spongiibacteraceae bacterium]HUH37671.1 50S ribosomal protein L25/general stress protein Ctc [Spongiibacteraceae bacterium]